MTLSQNSTQPLGITQGNAIVNASSVIYVLDNEPITIPTCPNSPCPFAGGTYPSQILPFSSARMAPSRRRPAASFPTLRRFPTRLPCSSNPRATLSTWPTRATTSPGQTRKRHRRLLHHQDPFVSAHVYHCRATFGTGSGPQCIVEDPSNQFIYTANQYDSTVTGQLVDPNAGELKPMRKNSTYTLPGPATWCLMDGRTS